MARSVTWTKARSITALKTVVAIVTLLLLAPFLLLAVIPMLLMLLPVALIGIPFIIPALIKGTFDARERSRLASWRPLREPAKAPH